MGNEDRLKELQDLFECQKCGQCCTVGGVVPITPEDRDLINSTLSFGHIIPQRAKLIKVEAPEELYVFGTKPPCPYFDCSKGECKIYVGRPLFCASYPFLSLLSGYSTINDIVSCPGALKALSEYLGVVPFKLEVK